MSDRSNLFRIPTLLAASLACCWGLGCSQSHFGNSDWLTPPWVRSEWEAEAQIADSLFSRKAEMTQAVASVSGAAVESQQQVASQLSEVILRDPILLLRLHALKLISTLDCPKTTETLNIATSDPSSDIRIAAVKALQQFPNSESVYQLQEIVANDSDDDVRLAATRALGNIPGQNSVRALGLALNDRNPALQITATESLMRVTGQSSVGRNVVAWQDYVKQVAPTIESPSLPVSSPTSIPGNAPTTLVADDPSGGEFRR